ncbi:cold-shock protein [Paenibacillus thailandensis]
MIGRVKKYFSEKGFGFIESEGTDYFFHVSEVKQGVQSIEPGLQVDSM